MTMTAASNIRELTKPSASASFCRLTTGNSATAVPMQARAITRSRKPAKSHLGVRARAEDVVRIVQHRADRKPAGIEVAKVIR